MRGLQEGCQRLCLEGVTGSGKTFTMASVIAAHQRPTLIISHNKTLAAQLFAELKGFFPHNAVEYFVSYYDYYQPEAYIPQTDTFIEKDAAINDEIERYRLSATNSLLNRQDVIIVASVSCIYGRLAEDYRSMLVELETGQDISRESVLEQLVAISTSATTSSAPAPSVRGDILDIFPRTARTARVEFFGDDHRHLPLRSRRLPFLERPTASWSRLPGTLSCHARRSTAPRPHPCRTRGARSLVRGARQAPRGAAHRPAHALRLGAARAGLCSGIENYPPSPDARRASRPPA